MKTLRHAFCFLSAALLSTLTAHATPYASGITNASGTIKFYLNEVPDSAYVIFEDGTSNSLASPVVGQNSFALGAHTAFSIYCTKLGNGTPVQLSSDTGPYNVEGNFRGVDVNCNPTNGALFGRIYFDRGEIGLYALNADESYVAGPAFTSSFNTASTSSPYRLSVGHDDNNVYVSDFESVDAMTWQVSPNLTTITPLFNGLGNSAGIAAGTHGEQFGHPIAFGSLATSNLVVWTADATLPIGNTTTLGYNAAPGNFNNLDVYDIGAGPLPWTNPPNLSITLGIASIGGLADEVDVDPVTSNIFGLNERFNYGMPIVQVYDSTGMHLLWDSITADGGSVGSGPDFFQPIGFVAYDGSVVNGSGGGLSGYAERVSPDGKYLAVAMLNNPVYIVNLTNGVPDISSLFIVSNAPNSGGYENVRGVAWDAADNVYTVSSGQALLRAFSLGTAATTIVSNDYTGTNGSFQLILPSITASVTATTPLASQNHGSPTPGVFTITLNTNFLATPLTVNFVIGGTSTNGTFIASATNSVTFAAGTAPSGNWSKTVSITPTATPVSGPTTTVTLKVTGAPTYLAVAPIQDTVYIVNTGPQALSITSVKSSTMYRGLTNDYVSFVVTRLGDTNAPTYTVTNFSYGGTAVFGVDYKAGAQSPPTTANSTLVSGTPGFTFSPGQVSQTVIVGEPVPTPYGAAPVGNKTLILSLGTSASQTSSEGVAYTVATNTITTTELDNANPPEVVLFSDSLNTASDSANWTLTYATTNLGAHTVRPIVIPHYANSSTNGYLNDSTGTNDFDVEFGYNVAADGVGYSQAMLSNGWTNALKMSVNEDPNLFIGSASGGVNVYPENTFFAGNYALRFSMELVEGSGYSGETLAQYALFGIDTYGTNCDWISGDISSYGSGYTNIDGWFADVGAAQGAATGGTPPDFGLNTGGQALSGPNLGNNGLPDNVWYQPTGDAAVTLGLQNTFKHPVPFSATGQGTPADQYGMPENSWCDVELKQVISGGSNLVILSINKTVVLSSTNTTTFTNGTIMLGDDAAFALNSAGGGGAVYYSDVRVVEFGPTITNQPSSVTVLQGQSASFTVTAIGAGPFTNVWYDGTTPISTNVEAGPVDTATLSFPSTLGTNSGTYTVVIGDASGTSVTSTPVTLTVLVPVTIAPGFPTNVTNNVGATVSFSVTNEVFGTAPFSYSWESNGVALTNGGQISGATNATLVIANITLADAGTYTVTVTNVDGTNQASATLTVITPPSPDITSVAMNPAGTQTVITFTTGDQYDTTNSFNLQISTNLAGPNDGFTNASGVSYKLTNGVFTVNAPTNGADAFYRLQHK